MESRAMDVLIVDDSPVMRRYIARTLEMTGIELRIHEAGNGREAIAEAVEVRPDLIITDLNMPEMTGEELVARVAADPALGGTPILVLSSDRSAARPGELLHAGAVAYLTKPVSPEALRHQLLRIMPRAMPPQETGSSV
ncbi:MAG TPA: response regulator [Bryobacteraceae bacterium]|jgi:CheY-like chemotaxis protein|nr:response regulator [Bryobacteraceae bacterium]